jgi:hypothetical protein
MLIRQTEPMTSRKRHTAQEIIVKMEQANQWLAEGKDLSTVYQELQISRATYHRWRARFETLKAREALMLKTLEEDNAVLRKQLLDAEVEITALREIARGKF